MSVELGNAEFEAAVEQALGLIPDGLAVLLDNVAIIVEDEPPSDEDPELLGLYEGIPLPERGDDWGFRLPDRVLIFQGPLQRWCADREQLLDEIAITVIHEIAHHFGIDDDELERLGWG